jgi:hypothetical protein
MNERLGQTFAVPHLLKSALVSERIFARLDDEGQTSRDGLSGLGLLGFLGGHCFLTRVVVVVGEGEWMDD